MMRIRYAKTRRCVGSAIAVSLAGALTMMAGPSRLTPAAQASPRIHPVSSPIHRAVPAVVPEDPNTPVQAPITVGQCRAQNASKSPQGWQRDAFSWCRSYGTYVEDIYKSPSPLPVGEIDYNLVMVASGSRTSRTATVRVYFDIADIQDPANILNLPAGTISVNVQCDPIPAAATCQPSTGPDTRTVAEWMAASADDAWPTGTGNSRWSAPFVLDTSTVGATNLAGTGGPPYVSKGVYYPVITFDNANVTPRTTTVNIGSDSLVTETSFPDSDANANMKGSVRFDSATYLSNGGAILGHADASGNPAFPVPVLHYDAAAGSPDQAVALHLYIALHYPDSTYPDFTNLGVHKIFPGVPGRELHRIDPSLADANDGYARSLCNRLWINYTAGGNQCDEYPFKSTAEGGSAAGFDISVCPLNGTQNGYAGTELNNFYLDNRVIVGDPFTVTIDNPPAVGSNPAATLPCPPPTKSTYIVINVPGGGSFQVKWSALGGSDTSSGTLGDPVSNFYNIAGGQEQDFQAGSIYWSSATGTDAVYGPIYSTYQQLGGATSHLGFPTDDPYSFNGGLRQDFFKGYILSGTGVPGVYYTSPPQGTSLVLRSNANGDYVSAELGYAGASYGMLRAAAAGPGPSAAWTAVPLDDGMMALQNNANGLYASTEVGYTGSDYAELRARASVVGPFEQYKIVNNADGTFSLKSLENGLYVSAELGYSGANFGELRARASSIGSWEEFTSSIPAGCTNYGALMTGPDGCIGFTTGSTWFSGGGTGWLGKEIWTYGNGTVQDSTATYQLAGLNNTVLWQLQAYIPDNHSDASHAHYHYCAPGGGCADGYINQNWYTNQWVTFGSTCTSDGTVSIVLADDGGDVYPAQVGADAIRAVRTNIGC